MKAITQEELNALKPSYYNPVELVCFDGHFPNYLKQISVVTPFIKEVYASIDSSGDLIALDAGDLKHYILKKQTNEVELFLTVGIFSRMELCDSDGHWYNFSGKNKNVGSNENSELSKKNRQPNPIAMLNLDSYELRWL